MSQFSPEVTNGPASCVCLFFQKYFLHIQTQSYAPFLSFHTNGNIHYSELSDFVLLFICSLNNKPWTSSTSIFNNVNI